MIPTAKVLINLALDRVFDYRIPPEFAGRIRPGMLVEVPFGNGKAPRQGYVVGLGQQPETTPLKDILSCRAEDPHLTDPLLKLASWIADYYCCARETAVRTLLPGAVRKGKIREKTRKLYILPDRGKAVHYREEHKRAKGKSLIIDFLLKRSGVEAEEILTSCGVTATVLKGLVKEGIIAIEEEALANPLMETDILPSRKLPPTEEQAAALEKITAKLDSPEERKKAHVILLHGVTASGKTEVYLQAIEKALEKGGEAIVLVPEISLTPQTVERFRARFGNMVSVLHSGLTDSQRYEEWMKVHRGEVKIAVGARSALFAPFRKLALIVVDEEHDSSYKQSETPRYHARDVAVVRGKMEDAVVILGSATPSLESYYNALNGKYTLAAMTKRTDETILLPEVKIVDMRLESDDEGRKSVFSQFLIDAVHKKIAAGEQCILFFNLRGYARKLLCTECNAYSAECPECSVAYTYHKKTRLLSCPRCGASIPAPEKCPLCSSTALQYKGVGTEKIENISFEVFNGARIARMDSDVMTSPRKYEETLSRFRRGETDILVGTQMIAKGLHFPNVTLVGLINADIGLNMPDFRALERGFQLITQVAGRAGRGESAGTVLVQTSLPFNPAVSYAANHDFIGFYEDEILIREELLYPPFTRLLALHFSGEDAEKTLAYAESIMEKVSPLLGEEDMTEGPAPAHYERVKGKYRFIATIRSKKIIPIKQALRKELFSGEARKMGVSFQIDVDALSMM